MLLLHPLITARLRVAPVLQGSSLLFETDDLVLGEASQVSVELSHRHGHQLVVREAVLHVESSPGAVVGRLGQVTVWMVMMMAMVMERLMRVG